MDDVSGARAPSPSASVTRPVPLAAPPELWLALALAAPLGPAACRRLADAYPDPAALAARLRLALGRERDAARAARASLAAPHGPLAPAHVAALDASATRRRIDDVLAWLDTDTAHHLVPIDHPRYPALLRATPDPPPLLYLRGSPATLAGPAVAVVGSRAASHGGRERAATIAAGLVAAGLVVVSGLALGTDAAAHAGALDGASPGTASTLAFTATGADLVYPKRHARLAAAMLERGGAMASEFPLGHPPQPWCFPQRNRLISGASLGVVVVEAALPSGSLTTARHALEQGREVMAVPGAVSNPRSAGCHALISDGAALVTCAEDVLRVLAGPLRRSLAPVDEAAMTTPAPPSVRAAPAAVATATRHVTATLATDGARASPALAGEQRDDPPPAQVVDPAERRVWYCLAYEDAVTLERLVARCDLAVAHVLGALAGLELAGLVVSESGGRYTRCRASDGRDAPPPLA